MSTLVYHVRDVPEKPGPEWVYCGRATPRAAHRIAHVDSPCRNPYRLHCPPASWGDKPWTLADLLTAYRNDLIRLIGLGARSFTIEKLRDGTQPTVRFPAPVPEMIERLAGKKLVCWCAPEGKPLRPDEPARCHAVFWAAAADGLPLPPVIGTAQGSLL